MTPSPEGVPVAPQESVPQPENPVIPKEWDIKVARVGQSKSPYKLNAQYVPPPDTRSPEKNKLDDIAETSKQRIEKGSNADDFVDYPEELRDDKRPADFFDNPEVAADWIKRRQEFHESYPKKHKDGILAAEADITSQVSTSIEKRRKAKIERERQEKETILSEAKSAKEAAATAKNEANVHREAALKAKVDADAAKELARREVAEARAAEAHAKEQAEKIAAEAAAAESARLAAELAKKENEAEKSASAAAAKIRSELDQKSRTTETSSGTRKKRSGIPESEADQLYIRPTEEDAEKAKGHTRVVRRTGVSNDKLKTPRIYTDNVYKSGKNSNETDNTGAKQSSEQVRQSPPALPENAPEGPASQENPVATPPDLYELNPHLQRPEEMRAARNAAYIPPNTPPSVEARAHATELMNRPTIKGRIWSGLTWPFRKVGSGIAEVGSWIKFQVQRVDDNIWMGHRNTKTDRSAARFEAEKSKFEIAKGKVINIEEAIAAIDKEKADNKEFITPKIAKKMERARRDLEMKLISAQEEQDHALNRIKLRESQTIFHENKRTEIAKHYAELVDNRLQPKREKLKELENRKAQYELEIKTWGEKVTSYEQKISALEVKSKNNPYCKSVCKAQIKAARKILNASKEEVEKRKNKITGTFGIDSGMFRDNLTDIRATLQKWENNKATYSRMADRKIKQFDQGHYIPATNANDIEYRSPVPRSPSEPAGVEGFAEETERARAEALENVPTTYSYDEWVKQWNALNGSTLNLDADTMVDSATLREYRASDGPSISAAGFSAIIKRFQSRPEVAAVTKKLSPKQTEKLAAETLERLREKAVDAYMSGESASS